MRFLKSLENFTSTYIDFFSIKNYFRWKKFDFKNRKNIFWKISNFLYKNIRKKFSKFFSKFFSYIFIKKIWNFSKNIFSIFEIEIFSSKIIFDRKIFYIGRSKIFQRFQKSHLEMLKITLNPKSADGSVFWKILWIWQRYVYMRFWEKNMCICGFVYMRFWEKFGMCICGLTCKFGCQYSV